MKLMFNIWATSILLLTSFDVTVTAHRLEPAYLEINEQNGGKYAVLWKRPFVGSKPMAIYPQLPVNSHNITEPVIQFTPNATVERWLVDFGEEGIVDKTITIDGLSKTETDTLLRIQLTNGTVHTTVLRPTAASYHVPEAVSKLNVSGAYLRFGIEHILAGFDHLLFVLGLLLIVQSTALLIKTITAFTVAHSITLGLAALGFVHVPQSPVEAVIALSIVFLATELVKQHRGEMGLTTKAPWLVAICFGLLHGFGFAGALTEVGLPQTEMPLALLFFNIGVEVGQLIFVAGVLCLLAVIKKLDIQYPLWVAYVPPYTIGSVAAFWFIQRTALF